MRSGWSTSVIVTCIMLNDAKYIVWETRVKSVVKMLAVVWNLILLEKKSLIQTRFR